MATSGELRALLVRSRGVLEQIKAKQVKVGGGSGRRERYEMRQTGLYFDLGSLLLEYFSQAGFQKAPRRTTFALTSQPPKEMGLAAAVNRWYVPFLPALRNTDSLPV